jgi:hypothetical protein
MAEIERVGRKIEQLIEDTQEVIERQRHPYVTGILTDADYGISCLDDPETKRRVADSRHGAVGVRTILDGLPGASVLDD